MNSFRKIKDFKIENIDCESHENYVGAKVVFIKDIEEKNLSFTLSVKTSVKNNKGIPHILEHCILEGSEKYPTKDLFNKMYESSVVTYLNCITYRDKTVYLVSSNEKDEFDKLVKVYVDCIFRPLNSEEIYLQEGLNKKIEGKEIEYGGVVLNEMAGYYGDYKNEIVEKIFNTIYIGEYKYISFGTMEGIKQSSYNEMLEYYDKFYNIKNMEIIFYGDVNKNKWLDLIERYSEEKIKKYEDIKMKETSLIKYKEITYSGKENIGNISIIFEFKNYYEKFKMDEIMKYVFKGNKIKNILLEEGINFKFYRYENEIKTPTLMIFYLGEVKNELKEKIKKIIIECIKNKKELLLSIEETKYKYLIGDFGYKPKGVQYSLDLVYRNMSFKGDKENIDYKKYLERIAYEIKKGEICNSIGEYFNNGNNFYEVQITGSDEIKEKKKIIDREELQVETVVSNGIEYNYIEVNKDVYMLDIAYEINIENNEIYHMKMLIDYWKENIKSNIYIKVDYELVRNIEGVRLLVIKMRTRKNDKAIDEIKKMISKLEESNVNIKAVGDNERINKLIENCEKISSENLKEEIEYINLKKSFNNLKKNVIMCNSKRKNVMRCIKINASNNLVGKLKELKTYDSKKGKPNSQKTYTGGCKVPIIKKEINYNNYYIEIKKEFKYIYIEIIGTIIKNHILNRDIRNKNGAYSCGYKIYPNELLLYSKEDPNVSETYEIFKNSFKEVYNMKNLEVAIKKALIEIKSNRNKRLNIEWEFNRISAEILLYNEKIMYEDNIGVDEIKGYIRKNILGNKKVFKYTFSNAEKK